MASLAMENHPDAQGPDETWKDFMARKDGLTTQIPVLRPMRLRPPLKRPKMRLQILMESHMAGASLCKSSSILSGQDNFKKVFKNISINMRKKYDTRSISG